MQIRNTIPSQQPGNYNKDEAKPSPPRQRVSPPLPDSMRRAAGTNVIEKKSADSHNKRQENKKDCPVKWRVDNIFGNGWKFQILRQGKIK
jgi:hypothetical protein